MAKKKKIEEQVKQQVIYVDYTETSTSGESESNEPYSNRATEYIEIDIKGLYLEKEPDSLYFRSLEYINGEFKESDEAYLLVIKYSSGDSFGHTEGNSYFEGLYKTQKEAEDVAEQIQHDEKLCEPIRYNKYTQKQFKEIESKKLYKKYKPWDGYFERLEDIQIHSFIINKKYKSGIKYISHK